MTAEEAQEQHREDAMKIFQAECKCCAILTNQLTKMEALLREVKQMNRIQEVHLDLFDLETSIVNVQEQVEKYIGQL